MGFVIVLSIVTLGVYGLYWTSKTYTELRAHRGDGVNGWIGLVLQLVVVGIFLLPSYVS